MGQTTSHPQGADLDVCAYRANITSNRLYLLRPLVLSRNGITARNASRVF